MKTSSVDKKLSIVLGSYNRLRFLTLTIESIRRELAQCQFPYEIIVVDGGSSDGTLKWLLKQKDILTIVQHNRGAWGGKAIERRSWGYFMNLGFKCAQGKYVCMLSDDCLVLPGAMLNGVALFDERLTAGEKIGAMAFYWRNWPEQESYWVGLTLGSKMTVNHGLYLNEALKEVGYIDEENYLFYYADGDLCLKMWEHGYAVIDSADSFIEHYSHANLEVRGANLSSERTDWNSYLEKWGGTYRDGAVDGAIYREYNDASRIAETFKDADVSNIYKNRLKSIYGRLVNIYRAYR
jgi:glycosyltransferase involved in cell wall biosynthesis